MTTYESPRPGGGTLSAPEAVLDTNESAGNGNSAPSEDAGIPANAIFHGECGKWWTGTERSHASCCHRTFNSLTAFETHRKGLRCNDPADVGLVSRPTRFGEVWGKPGPVGGIGGVYGDDDSGDAA